MHETLFFICGGILAASAVLVSIFGLKNEDFPGKLMPLVIVWFAVFAIGAGTFAVLHGKDESKDHEKEYVKAGEEIEFNETEGPFVKEQEEEAKEAAGEEGKEEPAGGEEAEGGEEEGEAGEEAEGAEEAASGETAGGGGSVEAGTVVFSENCSVCHGATGRGGNGGPDLTTMPLAKTEAGVIQQATNGGGGMPPFGGILSEEEIKNVASFVVQEITHGE
ncbi:MAG TPA: cytochrome c [Solirubrobacterales bacterium]|jgi:cytochrome c551